MEWRIPDIVIDKTRRGLEGRENGRGEDTFYGCAEKIRGRRRRYSINCYGCEEWRCVRRSEAFSDWASRYLITPALPEYDRYACPGCGEEISVIYLTLLFPARRYIPESFLLCCDCLFEREEDLHKGGWTGSQIGGEIPGSPEPPESQEGVYMDHIGPRLVREWGSKLLAGGYDRVRKEVTAALDWESELWVRLADAGRGRDPSLTLVHTLSQYGVDEERASIIRTSLSSLKSTEYGIAGARHRRRPEIFSVHPFKKYTIPREGEGEAAEALIFRRADELWRECLGKVGAALKGK
jgi:hypothetical protein